MTNKAKQNIDKDKRKSFAIVESDHPSLNSVSTDDT